MLCNKHPFSASVNENVKITLEDKTTFFVTLDNIQKGYNIKNPRFGMNPGRAFCDTHLTDFKFNE